MVAATISAGPRFAPEDPSLPKPWRGLVDGKTGYLYFWNPETNITQYERPGAPPKSASISSSVQVQQSQGQQRRDYGSNGDDDRLETRDLKVRNVCDTPETSCYNLDGQPESIVEDIENMVRSYVDKHCSIPLDTAKVRFRLQKKANTEDGVHLPKYRGTLNTVVTIAMDEGMLALWKGIVPRLHRQCLYSGLRIRLYEPVKLFLVGSDFIGDVSLFKMMLAALITGALAITVANPTDIVKVRLQAEGKLPAGIPRRYSGALKAYITILIVSSMRKSYYGFRKWSYSEIRQMDESEMWNNFIVCFSKKRSILK